MNFAQVSVERFARESEGQVYAVIEDALHPWLHRDLSDTVTDGGLQLANEFSPKLRQLCCLN